MITYWIDKNNCDLDNIYINKYELIDDLLYLDGKIQCKIITKNFIDENTIKIFDKILINKKIIDEQYEKENTENLKKYLQIKNKEYVIIETKNDNNFCIEEISQKKLFSLKSVVIKYCENNFYLLYENYDNIKIKIKEISKYKFNDKEIEVIWYTNSYTNYKKYLLVEKKDYELIIDIFYDNFSDNIKKIKYCVENDELENLIEFNNFNNKIFTLTYNKYKFIVIKLNENNIQIKYYNLEEDINHNTEISLKDINNVKKIYIP